MIVLPALSRTEIDAWSISRVGLPRRVVNALARNGITTVGQLRGRNDHDLLELRAFGVKSLKCIHDFFDLSQQLERGQVCHSNLEDFLRYVLLPSWRQVIEHRYGLRQAWMNPKGHCATLRALGTKRHLTRERVRQLQVMGYRQLQSYPNQLVLQRFAQHFAAQMDRRGGVVTLDFLKTLRDKMLGHYSGAGALLLLGQCTGRFHFHHGFFTTATAARLDSVQAVMLDALRLAPVPQLASEILQRFSTSDRNLASAILHHHPSIALTRRNEVFLPRQHGASLAEQVLRECNGPLHYRRIAEHYNALVTFRDRRRPRVVLRFLRASSRCERLSDGFYRFRTN